MIMNSFMLIVYSSFLKFITWYFLDFVNFSSYNNPFILTLRLFYWLAQENKKSR